MPRNYFIGDKNDSPVAFQSRIFISVFSGIEIVGGKNVRLPPTFSKGGKYINAVIETPKGGEAKYNFDPLTGTFKLK